MSNNARERALSRPTSIYRRTPLNIAVRNLKQLQSCLPDALVARTGRAGPVTDRTRWSSLSSALTKKWPDALYVAPDATEPAFNWSPISSQTNRTHPFNCDRTRCASDQKAETRADAEHWSDASGHIETASGLAFGHHCDLRSPSFDSPFHIWARLSMCVTLAHVLARKTTCDNASKLNIGVKKNRRFNYPKLSLPLKLQRHRKCANTTKWSCHVRVCYHFHNHFSRHY
jgi:hypothetical protein